MKQVLVLENVGQLEEVIKNFLLTMKKEWEITVIDRLSSRTQNEIIERLVAADILAIQSTFDDYKQFASILKLITIANQMKEKPLDIYVVYHYQNFENFINIDVRPDENLLIHEVLDAGSKLYDVKHIQLENAKKDVLFENKYFKDIFFKFDVVEMFFNKKRGIFWHVRRPLIKIHPDDYYRDEKEQKISSFVEKVMSLKPKEKNEFKVMLSEDYQRELDLKEDLETPGTWANECGDKDELLELRNARLSILDKLGIESYK